MSQQITGNLLTEKKTFLTTMEYLFIELMMEKKKTMFENSYPYTYVIRFDID